MLGFTNEGHAVTKDTNSSETSDPIESVQRSSPVLNSLSLDCSSTLLMPSTAALLSRLSLSEQKNASEELDGKEISEKKSHR